MKVIVKGKGTISKIWKAPKTNPESIYRLMKYVLQTECEEGTLLYNVVTSEMVLLDKNNKVLNTLPCKYDSTLDSLIEKRFIVPEEFDESKSVKQLRSIINAFKPRNGINGFTILPTTGCNARCYYCFQDSFKKQHMTLDVAEDVVQYICANCGKKKEIRIDWFGGEPLVGKNIIRYISNRLNENGIKFISSMISNGYLFDEDVVKEAKELWKLENIQISLDGTEEIYNTSKAYKGVTDNPYYRVLNNIDLLLKADIPVVIRLNVVETNVEDLKLLADELQERFGGRKGFGMYCHIVYGDVGYEPITYTESSKNQLYETTIELENYLSAKGLLGYRKELPYLKSLQCMSDNDESVIIYPNGNLGKCENSSPDDAVGSIYSGIDQKLCLKFKELFEDERCMHCPIYPHCIRLKVCPEKQICTDKMLEDKISRYKRYMELLYKQKDISNTETEQSDIVTDECLV